MASFKFRHQAARRRSRQLAGLFWLGLPICGLLYGALFYGLARFVFVWNTDNAREFGHWCGGLFIFIALVNYLNAHYDLTQLPAAELAKRLGASPLQPKNYPEHKRLENIVQELAIAAHQPQPQVMLLRQAEDINGLVLGDGTGQLVLCVSQGALHHLNRAELTALIAHEFGHIAADDVPINLHLTAVLYGYFSISQWADIGRIGLSPGHERSLFRFSLLHDENGQPTFLGLYLGFLGILLHCYGKVLQSAFARDRERMADAKAIEYTRDSSALVSVFKKMLALDRRGLHSQIATGEFAHLYFWSRESIFASHPSLEERIRNCGGRVIEQEINELARHLAN